MGIGRFIDIGSAAVKTQSDNSEASSRRIQWGNRKPKQRYPNIFARDPALQNSSA
jgi:hypothetical protein